MVNLKLVKLQYPVTNIGLFLEDWITLYDSFKVYESFRVISPNFYTKTILKSFSIGKLPLNNDYDEGEKLRFQIQLTCTLMSNYCNSFAPKLAEMIVSSKKTFRRT